MQTAHQRLETLVRTSDRTAPQTAWLEDELMAIRHYKLADYFIDLIDSGLVYSNESNSTVAFLVGICDDLPTGPAASIQTGRIDPPDVDLDFEDTRRDEIKEYLKERWKYVASISAFSKFSSRGLVRDLGRVFGIPLVEVNKVCKDFNSIEEFESLDATKAFRQKYPEILALAKKFEGRWRNKSVHPAGVVVANRPLEEILPMESRAVAGKERVRVVAYDMDDCAKVGLIKIDILGISQLSVVGDCLKIIKQRHDIDIDLDSIPLDDTQVFEQYSSGHTSGIFQADAPSYTSLLKRMKINSFFDLVVSNALVRPGPLVTVGKAYIERKNNFVPTPKEHEAVEKITSETYNTFIFQEQLLQALVEIGGFSWARADKVRKIIGKKRDPEEFKQYEEQWMENASKIVGVKKATNLWADFEKFAAYAFNRNHSAAYSLLSYQTMWLKTHYTIEYLFALLKNEKDQEKVTAFLIEAQRLGIEVLMPSVQKSGKYFNLEGDKIRFGLCNIKGIGVTTAEELLTKRPFVSKEDLEERVDGRKCNIKTRRALEACGALRDLHSGELDLDDESLYDLLGLPRGMDVTFDLGFEVTPLADFDSNKIQIIRGIVKRVTRFEREIGRGGMYQRFEMLDSSGSISLYADADTQEGKVIVGLASGSGLLDFTAEDEYLHRMQNNLPFTGFEKYLRSELFNGEQALYNYGIGKLGAEKALVIPVVVKRLITKKNLPMASVIVYDGTKTEKLLVFPRQYTRLANKIQPFVPIVIKADSLENEGEWAIKPEGIILAKDLMRMKGLISWT